MKKTIRIFPLMLGILLFFTQCEKEAEIDDTFNSDAFLSLKAGEVKCNSAEQILWAGAGQNDITKGTNVGTVTATIKDNELTVVYDVVYPWKGVEYHLWVGNSLPRTAAPGQFPYSGKASWTFNLDDLEFSDGDVIYIAAHAVVAEADLEGLEAELPETATFEIKLNAPDSYLFATVTEAGILDGEYLSYCINPGVGIDENKPYSLANVYSSYDVPDGIVPFKGNFPQVNWIINNIFVDENTTMADIQEAIWVLLFGPRGGNPGFPSSGPNSLGANQARVIEILTAANMNTGFMPGCNEHLVIVLRYPGVQPIIIWKPVPCGGEETAWAFGQRSFIRQGISRKWGWIFELKYCE